MIANIPFHPHFQKASYVYEYGLKQTTLHQLSHIA